MIEISIEGDLFDGKPIPEPLNGDDVWYEYCTQHDSRVRPSHAALDGTVWRADDANAPTPPLSYGCRCYLKMIAAPNSVMAAVLPVADVDPMTVAEAFATHLDEIAPAWKKIVTDIRGLVPAERANAAFNALRIAYPNLAGVDARDIAQMIVLAIREANL